MMAGVGRLLFAVLSGLSLLLCVTTVVLWVKGTGEVLALGKNELLTSEDGWLTLDHATYRQQAFKVLRARVSPRSSSNLVWQGLKAPPSPTPAHKKWSASLPLALMSPSLAALPCCWIVSFRRRKLATAQAFRGGCQRCGYDLRATPGRCPECGTVPIAMKGKT
jgi:hypothetical protein